MASELSRKCPMFMSWSKKDTETIAINALAKDMSWKGWERPYCFPPLLLIGQGLAKIREEQLREVLLVAAQTIFRSPDVHGSVSEETEDGERSGDQYVDWPIVNGRNQEAQISCVQGYWAEQTSVCHSNELCPSSIEDRHKVMI